MPNGKRAGDGGNAAKDPRNNLKAQENYKKKFKKETKRCTGFLHHDGPEIEITSFRQQKTNSSTGLQSRCDICNRLYFSVIQKPIKRVTAVVVWAEQSGEYDFRQSVPKSLITGIEECLKYWLEVPCSSAKCVYKFAHSSYRETAKELTRAWRDLDKGARVGKIRDSHSGQVLPAPKFMEDLNNWAGLEGVLENEVDYSYVWNWWCDLFEKDTATDSAERRAVSEGKMKGPAPEHPLSHFPWGSGNILETSQGHSVPGFNQVRASARVMPRASTASSRVYGYLVEGDRLGMMKKSKEFKKLGLSLGHSPAPLRWLGKDDPINAKGQPLSENVILNDSLIDLYKLTMSNPEDARKYVSWQINEVLIELANSKVSFEEFTQKIQSKVEEYFDELLDGIIAGQSSKLRMDLMRADPGKTETVYEYRERKVAQWLAERPAVKKRAAALKKL